jgi:hypothetical protein
VYPVGMSKGSVSSAMPPIGRVALDALSAVVAFRMGRFCAVALAKVKRMDRAIFMVLDGRDFAHLC